MKQLLSSAWWGSMMEPAGGWWLALFLLAIVYLPLVIRWFRVLPDRGIGLAPALAVLLTTYTAWVWSFAKGPKALAALVVVGLALIGAGVYLRGRKHAWKALVAGGVVALVSCFSWPHRGVTILLAAVAWGVIGLLLWEGRWKALAGELRRRWPLWVVVQVLLTLGFFYFVNVRSYIPWASFEAGMSGAEKFDNFAHLNACLRADRMPPTDVWWAGKPINYYYGGHLITATIAKLTGRPANIAFNLGLAMIFALTLTSAFSLTFNVVNRVARLRRCRYLKSLGFRAPVWVHGMGWGVLGAFGVAFFGNLDAWQQVLSRDVNPVRSTYDNYYSNEIKDWQQWREALETARKAENKREIKRLEASPKGRPPAKELTDWQIRLSWPNLLQVDFWRSSRMIKGSITEFPYFSAILGDHHAHHFALPFSIIALTAAAGVMRKGARHRRGTVVSWLKRAWPELLAMGFFVGAVFPINAWDAIILGPLYLIVILAAMKGMKAEPDWRRATWIGLFGVVMMALALILNARPGMKALLQSPVPLGIPILFVLLTLAWEKLHPRSMILWVRMGIWTTCVLALFAVTAASKRVIAGDMLLVLGVIFLVGIWSFFSEGLRWRWWGASITTYAVVGIIGLIAILPFKLYFHSPFYKPDKLLLSLFPPLLSADIFKATSVFDAMWSRVAINPFPANLRSQVRDYLGHWGQFWIPILFLWFAHLIRVARKWEPGKRAFLWLGLLALLYLTFDLMNSWLGPITLTLTAGALVLAFSFHRDVRNGTTWVFLSAVFAFSFFVEVLHFDDNYSGELERYNTPFKIYYPLWAPMALGMCVMLKELVSRRIPRVCPGLPPFTTVAPWTGLIVALILIRAFLGVAFAILALVLLAAVIVALIIPRTRSRMIEWLRIPEVGLRRFAWRIPLLLCSVVVLGAGMLYPAASTATRTNWFQRDTVIPGFQKNSPEKETYLQRTLDAMRYLDNKPKFKDDAAVIRWINENIADQPVICERIGEGAYQPGSRFATNTGLPTILGWEHHQLQWRGWGVPVSKEDLERFGDELKKRQSAANKPVEMVHLTGLLKEHVNKIYQAPRYEEIKDLLEFHKVRYVVVGSLEREAYAQHADGLKKFESPPFKKVFESGQTVLYEVAR